jgi:hypothetical protein
MNYKELFQSLKGVGQSNLSDLVLLIPNLEYALYPINCDPNKIDSDIVKMLTDARNSNANSFLTFFKATPEQTSDWLTSSVAKDNTRILFTIKNIYSKNLYGYMGLAYGDDAGKRIEGDAIVRFEKQSIPGLMKKAFSRLIEWTYTSVGIQDVWVRILSDNSAISFYEKCNFVKHSVAPLYEVKNKFKKIEQLVEKPNKNSKISSRTITYMKYKPTNI